MKHLSSTRHHFSMASGLNTRRYPRTLQEAFGPYAHGSDLQPLPGERNALTRKALAGLYAAIAIALLCVVVL